MKTLDYVFAFFLAAQRAFINADNFFLLNGRAPIVSLQRDGNIELVIKSEAPKPPETMSPQPGRRFSNLMTLSVAELQDLADHVHALMKPLAGCDPQIEVRVTIKNESSGDLLEATKVLAQVKPGWKF